jgi:hypothetical protein
MRWKLRGDELKRLPFAVAIKGVAVALAQAGTGVNGVRGDDALWRDG